MFRNLLICLVILIVAGSVASATDRPAPERLEGGIVISADGAKAIHDVGEALFIDVRNPINYGRGHIPSAVSMPFDGSREDAAEEKEFLDQLPEKKNTLIVIYSHGPTGIKSYRAALKAIEAGYRQIHWMREGLKAWEEKGYPVKYGTERE